MATARLTIAATRLAGERREAARVSDETLVRRIAEGDGAAVRILFARHHIGVYRFVLRIVRDAALAEELTSEIFLYVWRQAGGFGRRSAVKTWLLAIARYKALAALRRREHWPDGRTAAMPADPAIEPDGIVWDGDAAVRLRARLTVLPEEHREVIDLVYYHGQSVREVAEIVGIPEATAKARVLAARRRWHQRQPALRVQRAA